MRRAVILLVALCGLLASACGGEAETVVKTVTVPAETPSAAADKAAVETEPEPEEDPDTDGDGTIDDQDYAPEDPDVTTAEEAESCDAKGLTGVSGKEGNCENDGQLMRIVNRNTTLKLQEVAVKLQSIGAVQTIPREYDTPLTGNFVVANVAVTNRMDAPTQIDATEMFGLALGEKTYNPDFDAMNTGSSNLIYEEMQPDETATGQIVFKVSGKQARKLETSGNFMVLQFSDVGSFSDIAEKRIGIIRTYR